MHQLYSPEASQAHTTQPIIRSRERESETWSDAGIRSTENPYKQIYYLYKVIKLLTDRHLQRDIMIERRDNYSKEI